MRFKAALRDIQTLTRLTASLNSLGKQVWLRLDNDGVHFTVLPERGSQVWAVLAIDTIFETYSIQSATANNVINLRVPLAHLHRALRSALSASAAEIRLTKKDNQPLLSLTITVTSFSYNHNIPATTNAPLSTDEESINRRPRNGRSYGTADERQGLDDTFDMQYDQSRDNNRAGNQPQRTPRPFNSTHHRDAKITQNIPVQVLPPAEVAHLHEPVCPEPDVHILLPPTVFSQLRQISERFTRLQQIPESSKATSGVTRGALSTATDGPDYTSLHPPSTAATGLSSSSSRLILSANAEGMFRVRAETPALKIESQWTGLDNPDLNPATAGGDESVATHASTLRKQRAQRGEQTWAQVTVDGRDWGRVTSAGRMGGRVIACFCHEHALILYVYLQSPEGPDVERNGGIGGTENVLTYFISSYAS